MALSCNTPEPTATILAGKMEMAKGDSAFSIDPGKIELEHLRLQEPFRYHITIANNEAGTLEYRVRAQVPDYAETGYKTLTGNSPYRIEIPRQSILIGPYSQAMAEIVVTKVEETGNRYEGWISIKQLSESQVKLEMISRLLLK